ncbi:MAG: hypothetical protein KKF42_07400 [Actinobacteria bacterium]|nr:hypothetical protein [Actinomycetota bacterium]
MPVVKKVVNLLDPDYNLVTLHPGDEVPEWALERVTNASVLAAEPPRVEEISTGEQPATVELSELKKAELVALCETRGLPTSGNKEDLIARLEATPAVQEQGSGDAPVSDEPVDIWALDENELRALAGERGIDVSTATSAVELATVIEQAGQ